MFHFLYKNIDFAHKIDEKKKPTENYEKHLHHFYEIVFFVKGSVTYHVGEESKKLYKGDIVFINAGRNHFAEVDSQEVYERYVLKFDNSILPSYLLDKMKNIQTFYAGNAEENSIFKNLDNYIGHYNDEEIYLLFISLVTTLLVFLLNDTQRTEINYDANTAKLLEWIDNHLEENITLDKLAETFHYSSSQISTAFKKKMKIPLIRYIKMKKLIAAHQDIERGKKKNEVALRYSFDNYSTFYRLYVKTFGESPNGKKKN